MSENNSTPAGGDDATVENGEQEMSAQTKINAACVLLKITEDQFEETIKQNVALTTAAKKLGEKKLAAQVAKVEKSAAKDVLTKVQLEKKMAKEQRRTNKLVRKLQRGQWAHRAILSIWITAALLPVLIIGLIAASIIHGIKDEQAKTILKDSKKDIKAIVDKDYHPDDKSKQWPALKKEIEGKLTSEFKKKLEDVKKDSLKEKKRAIEKSDKAWKKTVKSKDSLLQKNALRVEMLDSALKTQKEMSQNLKKTNKSLESEVYEYRKKEVRHWAGSLKRSAYVWLYVKNMREIMKKDIVLILKDILGQFKKEEVSRKDIPRSWKVTRVDPKDESSPLCFDDVKRTLASLKSFQFPFKDLEGQLKNAGLID